MIIHVRKGGNKGARVLLLSVAKANPTLMAHAWRIFSHTQWNPSPCICAWAQKSTFLTKKSFEKLSGSPCAGNENICHCLGSIPYISVHYVLPNPTVSLPTWVMAAKMREETKISGRAMQAAFVQLQLPGRCCPLCVQMGTAVSSANWLAGNNKHAVASGEKMSKTREN